MIVIVIVHPNEVESVFPLIHSWVESALGADRTFTPEDIKASCESGQYVLRVIYLDGDLTGFFISSILQTPQGKILYGAWLGGKNLQDWVGRGLEEIEAWARNNGCMAYCFIGRKAWKKLLGYDYEGVYYYKNL